MSKMSELSQVLDEMIACGEGMIKAANAIKEIFSEAPAAEEKKEAPVKEPETKVEEKTYTAEEARGKLAKVSALGFSAQIKAILKNYGAEKFTALDPKHYAAVVAEAEELMNG